MSAELDAKVAGCVDRDRLVATACDLVAIPSFTGSEQACAEHLAGEMSTMGLETVVQQVEEGRANAVGRLPGNGEGPSLMFNGHLDTSYSGDEPWLNGPGFKPEPVIRDEVVLGLGIMNMKGAVACYLEAVRAISEAGIALQGDLVVAGVAGEIEKTQWGPDYAGAEYRGYGTGTRYLVTHGYLTDAAILGEPTEERVVLGHWGTMWARISTAGPFVHTAYTHGRVEENSVVRMHRVLEQVLPWITEWEEKASYRDRPGAVNVGSMQAGFPWRASRSPHRADLFLDIRVPPTMAMNQASREFRHLVRTLEAQFPDFGITSEIYLTVGGAEIAEDHPLISAIDEAHAVVTGAAPERAFSSSCSPATLSSVSIAFCRSRWWRSATSWVASCWWLASSARSDAASWRA